MSRKMNDSVAAVVVTFNRKEMLLKCLQGILFQTHPVDALFIIDNASTDDTRFALIHNGYLPEMAGLAGGETRAESSCRLPGAPDKVIPLYYLGLTKNVGSAGGFRIGMKKAYREGYDWIWTMDDDVIPQPDALEKQLEYQYQSQCIHPVRVNPDGTPFPEHLKVETDSGNGFFQVNSCCFEGALVHRRLLARAGFPDQQFFIVMDDKEFGLRVSEYTPIIYVREAKFIKQLPAKMTKWGRWRREAMPEWKLYYQVRNLFLLRERHPEKTAAGFALGIKILRIAVVNIMFAGHRYRAIRNILFGVWDGIKGKFGKTIRKLS